MAATRNSGTRQDTWLVTLSVAGNSFGVWDKKSGGALDSDDVKYYPGGMVPPISLGGKRTTDNVTLQRLYDKIDDQAKLTQLFNAVGKGVVKISQKPMDPDGKPFGSKGIQYTGILKRVLVPDVDSESTTAALIEVEVGITGYPTLA